MESITAMTKRKYIWIGLVAIAWFPSALALVNHPLAMTKALGDLVDGGLLVELWLRWGLSALLLVTGVATLFLLLTNRELWKMTAIVGSLGYLVADVIGFLNSPLHKGFTGYFEQKATLIEGIGRIEGLLGYIGALYGGAIAPLLHLAIVLGVAIMLWSPKYKYDKPASN